MACSPLVKFNGYTKFTNRKVRRVEKILSRVFASLGMFTEGVCVSINFDISEHKNTPRGAGSIERSSSMRKGFVDLDDRITKEMAAVKLCIKRVENLSHSICANLSNTSKSSKILPSTSACDGAKVEKLTPLQERVACLTRHYALESEDMSSLYTSDMMLQSENCGDDDMAIEPPSRSDKNESAGVIDPPHLPCEDGYEAITPSRSQIGNESAESDTPSHPMDESAGYKYPPHPLSEDESEDLILSRSSLGNESAESYAPSHLMDESAGQFPSPSSIEFLPSCAVERGGDTVGGCTSNGVFYLLRRKELACNWLGIPKPIIIEYMFVGYMPDSIHVTGECTVSDLLVPKGWDVFTAPYVPKTWEPPYSLYRG